jgi:hypothetical protein
MMYKDYSSSHELPQVFITVGSSPGLAGYNSRFQLVKTEPKPGLILESTLELGLELDPVMELKENLEPELEF